jgi:single-strand DNA-binding protein
MANLNKVLLIGRLTFDPDFKEFEGSGTKICDLRLALNRNWRDKHSGEKKEETTFVDVKVWGRQAEVCRDYLAKGREVFIEGRLELDQWEDKKTGEKRSKLRVVADRVQFIGGRGDAEGGGGGQSRGYGRSYGGGSDSGDSGGGSSGGGDKKSEGRGYDGGRYGSSKREKAPASSYDDDDIPF